MASQAHLDEHFGYLSDTRRTELLRKAIKELVRPGDRVLDLGCGTGVLGLFCLEAGAGHVTFVDQTDMIDVARRTMELAGHRDKCSFIRARSSEAVLSDRVDLVVCDNIGFFGVDYGVLETTKDARERFLKPEGKIFPRCVRLFASLVTSSDEVAPVARWTRPEVPHALHWIGAYSANFKWPAKFGEVKLLAEPALLGEFELGNDFADFFSVSFEQEPGRSSVANGVLGWFEAELSDGHLMTNNLLDVGRINRPQAFFPFGESLALTAGKLVEVTIKSRLSDDIWSWQARAPGGKILRKHSSLDFLLQERLISEELRPVPSLGPRAQVSRAVLNYCDGIRTESEIEELVLQDCRSLLPTECSLKAAIRRDLKRFTGSK